MKVPERPPTDLTYLQGLPLDQLAMIWGRDETTRNGRQGPLSVYEGHPQSWGGADCELSDYSSW